MFGDGDLTPQGADPPNAAAGAPERSEVGTVASDPVFRAKNAAKVTAKLEALGPDGFAAMQSSAAGRRDFQREVLREVQIEAIVSMRLAAAFQERGVPVSGPLFTEAEWAYMIKDDATRAQPYGFADPAVRAQFELERRNNLIPAFAALAAGPSESPKGKKSSGPGCAQAAALLSLALVVGAGLLIAAAQQ